MEDQLAELRDADRSLFSGIYAISALRDSRYHNTAYAIAELIDNSIEADAEQIELLCMEQPQLVKSRERQRVTGIAVLDNGTGMDVKTLFDALKFGGGTRHVPAMGHGKIGKYGMGLPTSSMSQCKRVDVWTWQDSLDSVWHSSIDADIIKQGDHSVPLPDQDTPIPDTWREAGSDEVFGSRSGTLVVWSKLDKIQWKTARAIIDNTSREVGRIHRHFVDADITRIRAVSFLNSRPRELEYETSVVANDPLYLMMPTSTPEPWAKAPMFTEWATREYPVTVEGMDVTIEVKYSIVKPEALKTELVTQNPGATEHGRHARHNIGVSVVREYREVVLEDAFLREGGSAENPQNRWWGCEVHFPRACDELFGVDHNKQMVAHFTQAARVLARDDRPNQRILDEMEIDDDDVIYAIVGDIRDQTRRMMDRIKQMFEQRREGDSKGKGGGRRSPAQKATQTATKADREAIEAGDEPPTKTDKDREQIPPGERESSLTEQLMEFVPTRDDAQELAKMLVREDISYQFNPTQLDGFQMFNVRPMPGVLHIGLNTEHRIYDLLKYLEDSIDESVDESNPAFQAAVTLRLLLTSWARMEDQTESSEVRRHIQDIGVNWGRQVDKVVKQLRDRDG